MGFTLLVVVLLLAAITPFVLRVFTAARFQDDIYTVQAVPENRVAIIFGARVMPSGRPSAMLGDRVRAGVDLYHAGKVDFLLMSGDNRVPEYNEPEAMRQVALRLGVPDEAIILDGLGIRTFETCARAKSIFGFEQAILVTQAFHLDRALLLCNSLGVEAVGVAADYQRPNGYSRRSMRYSQIREFAAITVAYYDVLRWRVGI